MERNYNIIVDYPGDSMEDMGRYRGYRRYPISIMERKQNIGFYPFLHRTIWEDIEDIEDILYRPWRKTIIL